MNRTIDQNNYSVDKKIQSIYYDKSNRYKPDNYCTAPIYAFNHLIIYLYKHLLFSI